MCTARMLLRRLCLGTSYAEWHMYLCNWFWPLLKFFQRKRIFKYILKTRKARGCPGYNHLWQPCFLSLVIEKRVSMKKRFIGCTSFGSFFFKKQIESIFLNVVALITGKFSCIQEIPFWASETQQSQVFSRKWILCAHSSSVYDIIFIWARQWKEITWVLMQVQTPPIYPNTTVTKR